MANVEMNGKEMPHISFLKFTAHAFKKELKTNKPECLKLFAVEAENKKYEFWHVRTGIFKPGD